MASGRNLHEADAFARDAILHELAKGADADVAKVSILLGICETHLTAAAPAARGWPERLGEETERQLRLFHDFAAQLSDKVPPGATTREKIRLIAQEIWGELTTSFSKDVLHVQHLSAFTSILGRAPGEKGKRLLDCAGVVTTTLLTAYRLSQLSTHEHSDLKDIRMQVSEDHCWITLSDEAERHQSVEITTTDKAKRGAAVEDGPWAGWLYTRGRALVCQPGAQLLSVLLVSVNPTIGLKASLSSEPSTDLEELQLSMLCAIHEHHPKSLYPGALLALGELQDYRLQAQAREAIQTQNSSALCTLMAQAEDIQNLYRQAALAPAGVDSGPGADRAEGHCWYPFSTRFLSLKGRGDFLLDEVGPSGTAMEGQGHNSTWEDTAWATYLQAFSVLGGEGSAAQRVLSTYRYQKTDEQLWKDLGCVLGHWEDALQWRRKHVGSELDQPQGELQMLLAFWDSICCLFSSHSLPGAWIGTVLKCAKMFSAGARTEAAKALQAQSVLMHQASDLWGNRLGQLRAVFEQPAQGDPGTTAGDGPAKRQRRSRH